MTDDTIHTCSYECERPGCIRAQRDYLAARLTAETSNARGKVEYEYEVWQGAVLQAGGRENDYASAQSEASHYAMMYVPDGPVEVRIYEKRLLSAAKVRPKRRPYNASGSLSEYGVFPECDAALDAATPPSQESAMDKPLPEAVVEAVARAICVACEENPDRQGDARGNEFRWQDYRDAALAAISAFTAAQQQPAEGEEVMVKTPNGVMFILPLQPSGLTSGPRFVVHVPGPEQPAAVAVDEAMVERACKAALDEVWPDTYEEADDLRAMIRRILSAALAAQQQEARNG